MNAFDHQFDGPAVVHYGDGEYVVLKPGGYVLCAVTGRRVSLDGLRYWSVSHQEAYADPASALAKWLSRNEPPES